MMAKVKFGAVIAVLAAAMSGPASADDLVRLAIGQRGLWDSSIAEIGQAAGIFRRRPTYRRPTTQVGGGERSGPPGRFRRWTKSARRPVSFAATDLRCRSSIRRAAARLSRR